MKNMGRNDITTMFIVIGKRINSISSDREEFNKIINQVIKFINTENFSFNQLDIMLNMAERAKNGVRKDAVVSYYMDRVIPCISKAKTEDSEQREMYRSVLSSQINKLEEYTESIDFMPSTSGEILDQIVPTKEINFQKISSETLEGVRNWLNEKHKVSNEPEL